MSGQPKWTPGPWACDLNAGEIYYNDGDILPLVATIQCDATSDEQAAADCHLISAAPDLYAALQGALEWMSCVEGPLRDGAPFKRNLESYRAALAKARGEA